MSPYLRSGTGILRATGAGSTVDSHSVPKGRVKSGTSLEKSHCTFLHCESLSKALWEDQGPCGRTGLDLVGDSLGCVILTTLVLHTVGAFHSRMNGGSH